MAFDLTSNRLTDLLVAAFSKVFPGATRSPVSENISLELSSRLIYTSGEFLDRDTVLRSLSSEQKGLAVYFGLKALHGQWDLQHSLVSALATHFAASPSYEGIDALLHDHVAAASFAPLKGPRVPSLFFYDPERVDHAFSALAYAVYHTDAPPALVGYGGLQGFGPFVHFLTPGTEFYVLIPPSFHADQPPYGYKIRKKNGAITVDYVHNPFSFLADRITLVDDFRTVSHKGISIPDYFAAHLGWPRIARERFIVE